MTVSDLRVVAEVFADLADVKTPIFVGHFRAVAALGAGAAEPLRLREQTRTDLELAGLLHDSGRVAVSTRIREDAGRLAIDGWEELRLHPFHSVRIVDGPISWPDCPSWWADIRNSPTWWPSSRPPLR